jgi:3,5-epimerase/4-reductase
VFADGGCNSVGCLSSVLQILQLYKDYIDPDFTWSNFTVEEQAKVIVAPRSNNLLDTQRVRGWF